VTPGEIPPNTDINAWAERNRLSGEYLPRIATATGAHRLELVCELAKTRVRDRVLALIALGELVGVVSTIALWGTVPHYFSFALLVLYPPAVWIGSLFRKPPSAVLP